MSHCKLWMAAAAMVLVGAGAQAQSLSLEGGGAASLTGIVPQTYAQFAAEEGLGLQVVLGQTLTRSALKVASGRIDMAVVPPPAFRAMTRGVGPYADNAEQAQELSSNVRALFGFPGGTFHPIVWADGGIESWGDIGANTRIYIGPPAGAASGQIQGMIELSTGGLTAEGGYEGIRAPWGAAQQGFQDGQYDVYVAAAAVGSQVINELGLQREIRILGIPGDLVGSEGYNGVMERGALTPARIPEDTYSGQANAEEDLSVFATSMMMAVHVDMDDDTAYALTRAYWENFEAMLNAPTP